jgi:hypothetical protein
MKKLVLPLGAILLLALAVPTAFSEAELGIGLSPGTVANPPDPYNVDPIIDFHVGWSYSILYLSWDAYAMPDYWVYNNTTYVDPGSGYVVQGYLVPGFLNLFDVGAKFEFLKPFLFYAEIGTNMLYLRGGATYGRFGVNARLGVGLKFRYWGVNFSGTQVFASTDDMNAAFHQGFAYGNWSDLTQGMVPTLNFVIYF